MLDFVPQTKVCSTCKRDLALELFGVQRRGLLGRKSECKKCLSEKEAARRAVDLEAARTYKRMWWAERNWTVEERKAAAERSRDWYSKNKGRHQSTLKAWIARNPEAFKAIQKKYLAKNPVHIRRKVYFDKIEKTLTAEQWQATLEVFGHRCAYCLRGDLPMTQDHVIPISKGGAHSEANVVPACKSCNSRKLARPVWVMANVKESSHGSSV